MTTSKNRVANPIAVRRFFVVGEPGREIVLTIGKPRPDPRPGEAWMCSFLIEGIPNERRRRAYGADSVQALQLALIDARRELDASGLPISQFADGEPGDLGLPYSAPSGWGVYFQHRIEHYIQRQELELASALTAILRERARWRAKHAADK